MRALTVSGIIVLVGIATPLLVHTGCGTSTGNPLIDIKFGTFTAQYSNPLLDLLIPSAYASLSNAKICIRRLRFKVDSSGSAKAGDSGDLDFQPGEVVLSAGGTSSLGKVNIAPGTYNRVEFDLTRDGAGCTSGYSMAFTNSNGSYFTTDNATIKFEGSFVAQAGNDKTLNLGIQSIITALNSVSGTQGSNSVIKTTVEDASVKGNF